MSMKIYFCGSIQGGRDDADLYARLIKHLKGYGQVLTEHVGEKNITTSESTDMKYVHERDMEWLQAADAIVAEVTQPSLGVGYEIGRAMTMHKPILCLFRPNTGKKLSCLIQGIHDGEKVFVNNYKEEEAEEQIKTFFDRIAKI